MELFDAHTHLQEPKLLGNIENVLKRASEANVSTLASCGTSEKDWSALAAISIKYNQVIPSFGLHPWYIRTVTPDWKEKLRQLLKTHANAGVGETGLDFVMDDPDKPNQITSFEFHLELASVFQRPVSIHCRKAWDALIISLSKFAPLPSGFMIHSCSAPHELIPRLIKLGAFISFSGSVTKSHNKKAKLCATTVPTQRLLAETDSPDLHPAGVARDHPNEPANLPLIIRSLSEIRDVPTDAIAKITYQNALNFFRGTKK